MPILRYTTQIEAVKTVGEIQGILAAAGAESVLTEYGPTGLVAALSFRMNTVNGQLAFRLPCRTAGVLKRLEAGEVPKRLQNEKQAARVSWRILKNWVEAQLAIVETEHAELAEVFLPYMQDPKTGRTVYENLKLGKFKQLSSDG